MDQVASLATILELLNAKVLASIWIVETADLVHEPCSASLNSLDHVDVSIMVRSPGRDSELKMRADVRGINKLSSNLFKILVELLILIVLFLENISKMAFIPILIFRSEYLT